MNPGIYGSWRQVLLFSFPKLTYLAIFARLQMINFLVEEIVLKNGFWLRLFFQSGIVVKLSVMFLSGPLFSPR